MSCPTPTVRDPDQWHGLCACLRIQASLDLHQRPVRGDHYAGRAGVPFAPDSNLVCLALNPAGNRDVGRANAFARRLHEELRCDPHRPLQVKEFFGSMTTLRPDALAAAELQRIAAQLRLDPASFSPTADRLVILRHTLMNPYLIDRENGISYIDRYFDYLATLVRALA